MSHRHAEYAHIPGLAARSLAVAVIKQAVADALDPTVPREVQEDAQQFLAGDAWYDAWCTVAEMQPEPLIHRRAA